MNKIFKVVWSKTKECYVVVSEVAKNNGGKKKVLASVLAGLAMVSIGQVQAAQTQYGSGSTATGAEATAVGVSSTATKSYATAVGYLNKAEGIASIAAGSNNKVIADAAGVQSDYSYAVGSNNTITGSTYASAFGRENNVVGEGSTALGYNNLVGIDRASGNAIVDAATGAKGAGRATAIGYQSEARGNRNVAIGNQAIAQRDDSVAIGSEVQALSGHNIAIGSKSVAQASTDKASVGIAIGLNVKAVGQSTTDKDLIAIGNSSNATANGAVAIGSLANATGRNSYAMGNNATASASGAVAIGQVAGATGHGATAFGNGAQSYGIGSTGIGRLSYASENGATAIGANSAATGYNSIAIGADEVTGTGNLDYVNNNFKTPGATADTIGSTRASGKYAVALSTEARASKDDAVAIGHKATASIAGGVALGSESKTTKAAGEIGYNPATGRTNDYNKLTNNTKAALTSTRAAVSIGDDSASVTRQLTGLAAGTQDTDAVNVAQLKAVNLKFAGDSTQVTGSTDVRLNDGTFNVNGDGTLISTEATATGIKVKAKVGGTITNDPSNDGKAKAPTTDGIATTTNVTDAINNSGWKVTSSNNGGTTNGTSVEKVSPGDKVTFSAGKNIVLDQNGKQFTYSLSDTVALTNTGSLTVGNTKVNNGGVTITAPTGGSTTNVTLTQSGLDNGGNKIVNVKDGDVSATSKDAVNGSQLHAVAAKERHIAPTTASHAAYTVDNNGDVTLDYVDGDGAATSEKAIIKGVAKQDLSNITNAGKQVITGLSNKVVAGDNVTVDETEDATTKQKTYKVNAKLAKLEDGTNTTVSGNGTAANPYHVNVAGDLTGISSITNGGTNNGKISFGPNKTVTVDGDHSITLNASTGTIGGLQNKTFDPTNITSGQAATEDQLKSVHDTLKASELHIAPTESNRTGEHIAGGATSNTAAGAAANAYKYDATTKQVVLEYNDGTGANKTGTKAVIDFSALNTGAGASSWNIASDKVSTTEGTVAAGSAATQNIADGKTVTMKAGKNLTVKQENVGGNASVAFSLDKDLKDLDSVTTNKTITKEITLKDPNGGSTSTTIKKDGDRITYTNDGSTTVNKVANLADEKHITPGTYSVDNTGKVTMTYTDGNNTLVPNTTTVIDGLVTKKLDNIDNDGKKTITGLGTIVKAGDNVTVSEASDATTGQKTYTVNAVTPAVYTKADGTKVVKRPNGTYTTNLDGSAGNDVPASDVIVSFQDAAGHTTGGNSIVNNVGSAIDKTGTSTGNTFLTKLDTAANDTPNAAVNVKDLKNTSDAIIDKGLKFDANSGGVKTNKLGSTVKVQGAGTSADANYSGANIKTFIDQDTAGNTTIDVKLDKNLTGINSITGDTNSGKLVFQDPAATGNNGDAFKFTGGNINAGGNNITNLKSGIVNNNATDDTNAANIGDVKTIAKDTDLHIAPTESNRTGEHIAGGATGNTAAGAAANAYKYDATTKQVVLEYNDGNGTNKTGTKAVIDLSNLPTGGDMSSFKVTSSAESTTVGTHAGDTSQEIKNGKSVDFQAGKNMTVKQTNDTNGNTTINYALNKDLDVESVHVGKDGKDGKIGIDGKDGVDGLDGTNRVDIHVEKGAKGVDGTDGHNGVNGHNGKDGMTRIVYEDKGGKQEVATLNDGMKYAGDDAQGTDKTKVIAKKLNETLDIIGGATKADLTTDNIGVNNDGNGKLLVQLSKNLKGINTIKNGNTTITLNDTPSTTTPAVTITGGNLSLGDGTTNNKIVNVAPGTDDTDAVNVKQLKDAKTVLADGKNTKKSGTGTAADPYKVNVEGDLTEITSITNKADASGNNAGKITFSPNQTVTVSGDHNISLNGKTGDITGLTNTTIPTAAGSDFATKGRAATEEQLKVVNDKFNNKINLGADTNETTKFQLDNASGIKFNIKGDGSGTGGANQYISTTANGSNVNVDLTADAKAKLNKTYTVSSGSTNVTVTPTTTGDNTDFKITVASTGTTTSSSWNLATDKVSATEGTVAAGSAATQNIADTKTVTMQAGKNLTVKQTNDGTGNAYVAYSLDKDISVENITVTGQNGKDGSIGINGKDGVTRNITVEVPGQAGQPGTPGVDGTTTTRIVFDGKAQANLDDGLKFTGNNESTENKHKLNTLVKVQGEGTKESTAVDPATGKKYVVLSDGTTKFESAKDNIAVEANGTDTLTVKLNKNLKGLDSVQTKTVELGDHTTPGGTTNITYNTGDNRIEYTTPGTTDTKKVATTDDIWTIQGNGTDVKPVNGKVNVKAGDNVVIKTPTTADGSMTISAVTSAVYTKADGTKVYKIIDPTTGVVTWNTKADGTGTPVHASDVIVSFQDADGNTTGGGSIVNNVGSAIDKTGTSTGNAFLTKLDTAANATPNAAVNVKDLKNTSDALINKGLNFTGNNDATVNAHKLGSLVKVQGEGVTAAQVAGFQSAEGNIAVVANSTDTLEIKLNKNLKGINSVSNGSSSITLNSNPGGTNNIPAVQITGGNLSMGDGTTNGNNKIVNLAPGTDNNDAVNVKQLKAAKTVVEAGPNVTVNKTTGANGEDVYTVSTTGGGTGTASSWNVKSTGNTDPTSETAAKNISDGKTVEMAAGKNLTVKQTSDTNGAKVEFALNKDLSNLDKVVVNGKDGIAGKDGVTIIGPQGATGATGMPGTNGIDGKVGISGKDGKDAVSISGKDGVGTIGLTGPQGPAGADGKGVDISTDHGTQTLVKPEAHNGNKSERIVYVPKDKDGNPLKDTDGNTIKREVATMDDGLKFAGDDGQANQDTNPNVIKKQLNNVVDIIGGADKNKLTENNIGVNNDNGKLKVQLSKEINLTPSGKLTIGDTTVNTGGLTITGGPSVKKDGIDAGSKKITNVANGDVNATSKDAVNGSQLYQAMQDAKTHLDHGQNTTVSGTGTQADPYKVNVQGDLNKISSITNNAGDGKVKFDPNQTVTVAGDHNISLNGKTGDITGLTNTSIGGADFATKGRAATEEQLKEAMNSSVEKVKKAADGANDKNIAEVNPTGGATNYGKAGTTYEVSVSRNAVESNARLSYTDNGNPSKKVTLSEGLNFKNGTNTTARTEPNGQVFYDVNPNLQNISSISGSTTGNGPRISFNNAGANSTVNIDGGNLNMNNNKITHVANGTDDNDAVNVSQLKAARTKVTSNDGTVSVNRSENTTTGEITYDLHVTPGQSPDLTRITNKVDQLGEEIGRVGAQGAALSALKPIQYDPLEPTQIMAGYGNYRGNSAVALGVAHYKNESTLIHGGVSWAGGSSHMMANAGVTWKVGNRDSEAAVADRYRKGPISSAYAMQQEMAAMKAQNAGLKGEVSDLKAENEQMKAQIAAMMAKLGL